VGAADETRPETRPAPAASGTHLCLQLVLCGEQPLWGGLAFDLAGLTEIAIGRGAPLGIAGDGPGRARIEIPDPSMSGSHVHLTLAPDLTARLQDVGSRNGTRVLGERVRDRVLREGDWFVAGRTAFRLRRSEARVDGGPFRIAGAPRLATFVPALAEQHRIAARLALSRVPLLIVAETGTGKEVLAHEIHALSGRAGPLVAVNCAALPETLVESELFGYRRGAFSDAREDRPGLLRASSGGTLLLDEIGDLPPASQAKLLRVLQEGEVTSLGATAPVKVDLRVIAATQQSLDELTRRGDFRADLYGRLSGYTVTLPPLRERMDDLGLLVATLLERHAGQKAAEVRITADAVCALLARSFPLNVRELERVVEVAVQLSGGDGEIGAAHFPPPPRISPAGDLSSEALVEALRAALKKHHGNVSAVAREMGKARVQIHRWMKQHGLRADDLKE